MADHAQILNELVEIEPGLDAQREELTEMIEVCDEYSEQVLAQIKGSHELIRKAVAAQPEPHQTFLVRVDETFAKWGIDKVKMAKLFGIEAGDVYKIVAMSIEQEPGTDVEKETVKSYVLSKLRPEMDVISDS